MIPASLRLPDPERRGLLLVLVSALAVVIGFVSVPDRLAIGLVAKCGFWLVLVAFGGWVWSLHATFRPAWPGREEVRRWDWISIVVVGLGGVVLLVHESFGFKIVMDEIMLLGTSMSMHLDKSALTPTRGNDIQGAFVVVEGIVDKRPLFFPFLVSLLHDLTGYRPANAFVLNGLLAFGFLGLVFRLGLRLAGRVAGWLAVALFAGLPLLAQNATGGGFELLNLTMILATLLLGARWVERRDGPALNAFCLAGLLLAQVRYESVIFLLPVGLLVLWVWWREGRVILTWPVTLAPLLLLHVPLQHRIFQLRDSSWEMFSRPGYSEPFSLAYIPDNLAHALRFFFGAAADQPNSLVLSALGVVALPFFGLLLGRKLRGLAAEPPVQVAVAAFAVGFALQFLLLMSYFWGGFDDVVIRRLSLPTHLALVIALLAVLPDFGRPAVVRVLLALAAVGLLGRNIPSMAAHAYSQEYLPGRETAWRREFMAAQPQRDYLMIDNDSPLWVSHRISSTPTTVAVKRRTDIAFHLRNRTFSAVYVFQRFNIDADTGRKTLREGDDLGPDFVLEPVTEARLQLLTLTRISRVTDIREGGASAVVRPVVRRGPEKSAAEIEEGRRLFLESYMRQLP